MIADDSCFLLTCWGSFVCYDAEGRRLTQCRLDDPDAEAHPAPFLLRGTALQSALKAPDQFEIVHNAGKGLVSLRRNGLFLCATPDGLVAASRETASRWESFILVSGQDLEAIRFLLRHSWIENSTARLLRNTANSILADFRLRLDGIEFDLLHNLPILLTQDGWKADITDQQRGFRTCILWQDQWKPTLLSLYRPLVFYCAFGEKSLPLLSASVRSLVDLAGYAGDLLLLTDMTHQQIEPCAQQCRPDRLHVVTTSAHDMIDFCSARYRVGDWNAAEQFQPLLYVDTDVAFDLDPERMFVELALSSRMSAQREPQHRLASHLPVGASLFREAGIDVGDCEGFNSGIIGIPCLAAHKLTLKQIDSAIYRYIDAKQNRRPLSHFDQPVANYIGFITNTFDLDLCTRYIRWMHTHAIHGGSERLGFVHFWGAKDKVRELESYVDALLGCRERPETKAA